MIDHRYVWAQRGLLFGNRYEFNVQTGSVIMDKLVIKYIANCRRPAYLCSGTVYNVQTGNQICLS